MLSAVGTGFGGLSGSLFARMAGNAKSRKIPFNITKEQAWEQFQKQDGRCALSGIELVLALPLAKSTASLDRIDSNRGYTSDNIQWVHKTVNLMKNALTEKEFLDFVAKIHSHKNLDNPAPVV